MKKHILNLLLQSTQGELFIVNKKNEYEFRKGYMKNMSFETLYIQYKNDFIDYLDFLYETANIVDRKIIYGIKKQLLK